VTTERAERIGAKTIDYMVDGVGQNTSDKRLTPRQILVSAGLNPEQRYLIELLEGGRQLSYKDAMDTPIRMRDGQEFVTASVGPTPVS
jgi:hypothetical protein